MIIFDNICIDFSSITSILNSLQLMKWRISFSFLFFFFFLMSTICVGKCDAKEFRILENLCSSPWKYRFPWKQSESWKQFALEFHNIFFVWKVIICARKWLDKNIYLCIDQHRIIYSTRESANCQERYKNTHSMCSSKSFKTVC